MMQFKTFKHQGELTQHQVITYLLSTTNQLMKLDKNTLTSKEAQDLIFDLKQLGKLIYFLF